MNDHKVPRQLRLTEHAQVRCQQRGISPNVLSTVLRFGKCKPTKDGRSYSMDHPARRRAERALGKTAYGRISDKLNIYIVVATNDEYVVTVAHRLRRRRN